MVYLYPYPTQSHTLSMGKGISKVGVVYVEIHVFMYQYIGYMNTRIHLYLDT